MPNHNQMHKQSNLQKELLAMSVAAAASMNAVKDNDTGKGKKGKNSSRGSNQQQNKQSQQQQQQQQHYQQLSRGPKDIANDLGKIVKLMICWTSWH